MNRKARPALNFVACCLTTVLVANGLIMAQAQNTGTVIGTLTDSSGAVAPGAAITLQLHTLFPNAKLGMGEWGYTSNKPPSDLSTVLQEGYSINPSASLPFGTWVGGVFYWEFGLTAVPRTGKNKLGSTSDWSQVDTDLQNQQ
jgi:hypothetical protein